MPIEPWQAVSGKKDEGNACFKEGNYAEAITQYDAAFAIAHTCANAYGLDDDLYGKLHGNRAEAYLQLGQYERALEDAEQAIEYDPTFTKAYVRKAKACSALDRHDEAASCLKDALDVSPGNKEVLSLQVCACMAASDQQARHSSTLTAHPPTTHHTPSLRLLITLQDEYRVSNIARTNTDATLTDLHGLCTRLSALLKRKGTATEVIAIFKQLPTLLMALKLVEDVGNIGDRGYESAPNYDAQVYFRMQTNNFALLAPLIRPLPKQPELLRECLETLASALRDCPSNQIAFDKYVPQLVPLLRAKATLPYELLKVSVKVLGTMAHRVSARKIMYDPDSAEGVMHVLSHPDSSQARPATAIDEPRYEYLGNTTSVPDACDTFWREHSRREDIRTPARSIFARFGHSACRKRLRIVERTKRLGASSSR